MEKRKVKVFNKSNNSLPDYSTEFSAGFDLRVDLSRVHKKEDLVGRLEYVSFEINEKGNKVVTLFPGGRVLVPTGLHVEIPDGYELQIRPRSGLSIKHGIMVVNSPGTIDCFTEDSLLTMINGYKKIKDININDIILSFNEDKGIIEKDVVVGIIDTGIQEVYEIETENGILEITPNTLVYTKDGIKKAYQLTEDDEIIIE